MTPPLSTVLTSLLGREPSARELDLVRRSALRIDSPDHELMAVVMTRRQARLVARLVAEHAPEELDLALRMGTDGRALA